MCDELLCFGIKCLWNSKRVNIELILSQFELVIFVCPSVSDAIIKDLAMYEQY